MIEKIVKETFKPDEEEVKKDDKVIEAEHVEHKTKLPKESEIDERETLTRGVPEGRGAISWKK